MNTQVSTQTLTKNEIIKRIDEEFDDDDFLSFENGFEYINIRGHSVWGMDKEKVFIDNGTIPYSMLSEKELNKVYNAYNDYCEAEY